MKSIDHTIEHAGSLYVVAFCWKGASDPIGASIHAMGPRGPHLVPMFLGNWSREDQDFYGMRDADQQPAYAADAGLVRALRERVSTIVAADPDLGLPARKMLRMKILRAVQNQEESVEDAYRELFPCGDLS